MSVIDIIILAIVALFVWKGVKLGLIEAVGGIIGLFVGVFLAGRYFMAIAEAIQGPLFNSQTFARVIAFILIFIIVNRLIAFVFWIVDKAFDILAFIPLLKTFNHFLGGIFGLVEALLLIAILVFFFSKAPFGSNLNNKIQESRFAGFIKTADVIIKPFIPESVENWYPKMPTIPLPKLK